MWEAVKNTHGVNRSGLNVAYSKDNSITDIGNKAFVAGTKSKRDWIEDAMFIPNWNHNQMFSNVVSEAAGDYAGLASTALLNNLTGNPEVSLAVGADVGKKAKEYVYEKSKAIGDTKSLTRYKQLENYLELNKDINELISHSMGSSVSLEYGKDKPDITNYTYGAPLVNLDSNLNTTRYRQRGDIFSVFDRGARTYETRDPLNLPDNHNYLGIEGVTANTTLSDGTEILIE